MSLNVATAAGGKAVRLAAIREAAPLGDADTVRLYVMETSPPEQTSKAG